MRNPWSLTITCYFDGGAFTSGLMCGAYKVVHLLSGHCSAIINHRLTSFAAGEVIFLDPLDNVEWRFNCQVILYVCQVRPEYFNDQPHLVRLFSKHALFKSQKVLKDLTHSQDQAIRMLFRLMRQEQNGPHPDRKDAIVIYLQMLLMLANRFLLYQLTLVN